MKSAQPKITVRIQRGIWFNVRLIRCTRLPSPIKFSIGCSFARLVLRFKPFELVFALHIHLFPNYFAFPYVFFSAVAIFGYCYYVRINKRFVISSCVLHFSFIFFVQLLCCGRWWVSGLTLLRYVILLFLSSFIFFSLLCTQRAQTDLTESSNRFILEYIDFVLFMEETVNNWCESSKIRNGFFFFHHSQWESWCGSWVAFQPITDCDFKMIVFFLVFVFVWNKL